MPTDVLTSPADLLRDRLANQMAQSRASLRVRGLAPAQVQAPVAAPVVDPVEAARAEMDQARATLALACERARGDMVRHIAAASCHTGCLDGRQMVLWNDLLGFEPTRGANLVPDQLWLLRSMDGALTRLLRLRENGRLEGQPDMPDGQWDLQNGVLRFQLPHLATAIQFTITGEAAGRPMLVGRSGLAGAQAVFVLTPSNCMYSQLRMLHPELTHSMAGLFRPDELVDPGLPEVPVVLLAEHRTGSHLLLNLLNSSDNVLIDGEIFNAGMISVFGADLPSNRKDGLDMIRMSDPLRFAKVMMGRSHHEDGRTLDHVKVRGFKLFPEHSRPMFDWAMDTPEVRVIHLYRENLLAQYSSYVMAKRDKAWVGGPDAKARAKVFFDRERFERFVDMSQRYHADVTRRLAARAGAWAQVEYSRIDRATVAGLHAMLTGESGHVRFDALGLKRQLEGAVIDRFSNPDDVRASLAALGRPEWAGVESQEIGTL